MVPYREAAPRRGSGRWCEGVSTRECEEGSGGRKGAWDGGEGPRVWGIPKGPERVGVGWGKGPRTGLEAPGMGCLRNPLQHRPRHATLALCKKKNFFHQKLEPTSKQLPSSFTISLLNMAHSNNNKNESFIKFLSYSSLAKQVILDPFNRFS